MKIAGEKTQTRYNKSMVFS